METNVKRRRSDDNVQNASQLSQDSQISRTSRYVAPADFIFKINYFSILVNSATQKLESTSFESGGYKWRLWLYPRGNKEEDAEGHISLYLSMVDTFEGRDFEVNVCFKFFVFNQLKDEYLSVQVDGGVISRFHNLKTVWGYDKLLPVSTFDDPKNGYLVRDSCAFGVEIYVLKSKNVVIQSLDLSESYLLNSTYTWKINDFRRAQEIGNKLTSPEFHIHGWKWKLSLHPNGDVEQKGKCISLYLYIVGLNSSENNKELDVKFKLRILEHCSGKSKEREGTSKYSSKNMAWGFAGLLPLSDLNDPLKKYLHNNSLVAQVEICSLSS